jgi:hypothetical protein
MTNSKVSGSRTLKKGSKKSSKKGSNKSSNKKHNAIDFSGLLNEMDDVPKNHPQMEGMMQTMSTMPGANMMQNMSTMPGAEMMPGMPGPNMMPMMPQMGMDQMGMAQMAMPQMGMPQMMMGVDPSNVDPLHLHNFVPRNENINISNYGVNPDQLMSGSQMGQQFAGRSAAAPSAASAINRKFYKY